MLVRQKCSAGNPSPTQLVAHLESFLWDTTAPPMAVSSLSPWGPTSGIRRRISPHLAWGSESEIHQPQDLTERHTKKQGVAPGGSGISWLTQKGAPSHSL